MSTVYILNRTRLIVENIEIHTRSTQAVCTELDIAHREMMERVADEIGRLVRKGARVKYTTPLASNGNGIVIHYDDDEGVPMECYYQISTRELISE
ncbi:hypothetical protein NVP1015O_65 [Vibrio phage 1.015.O._10N.222.51.E5]|nr:hypothetical protein NVP1015O_65 [Vibrio phage 1.015.O._10N.222.51.E5]